MILTTKYHSPHMSKLERATLQPLHTATRILFITQVKIVEITKTI